MKIGNVTEPSTAGRRPALRNAGLRPVRRRGIALLLVMIALCVGTILTAGFLASQGTSIGLARNEQNQAACRALAESGCEMGMWLVRNKIDWRSTMSPGSWLTNYPLGAGTVTVTATDGNNNGSFMTDPTQSVIFTSTATISGRSFTVVATMTPTGGGVPFSGGVFSNATATIQDNAYVDSYDSTQFPYVVSHGSNAVLWSNAIGPPSLNLITNGNLKGTLKINPSAVAGSAASLLAGDTFTPAAVAPAVEARTPGRVIVPNTTSFTDTQNPYTYGVSTTLATTNIIYNSFTLTGTFMSNTTCTINRSAVYYIRGNMSLDQYSNITVTNNSPVIFLIDGNLSLQGKLTVNSGSQLQMYFGGNLDISGNAAAGNNTRTTSLQLLGTSTCGSVTIRNTASVSAAIMAPNASATIRDSAKLYGSVIAQQLLVRDSAQIHQDARVNTLTLHNVTAGSYAGDYRVTWQE